MTKLTKARNASAVAQSSETPVVGIIMGSRSDWETMSAARDTLVELGIPCEVRVVSAHRMPDEMFEYATSAAGRGLSVIIAGAGGAAHLPGMTAAKTLIPVIGVPVQSRAVGLDSLLSIAQMPPGVPVATMAIGGAVNAALFAARIVALNDAGVAQRLAAYVARMHDAAASSTLD
jgi:5-(carboxyamino)imidazole ribonucleotide mutase